MWLWVAINLDWRKYWQRRLRRYINPLYFLATSNNNIFVEKFFICVWLWFQIHANESFVNMLRRNLINKLHNKSSIVLKNIWICLFELNLRNCYWWPQIRIILYFVAFRAILLHLLFNTSPLILILSLWFDCLLQIIITLLIAAMMSTKKFFNLRMCQFFIDLIIFLFWVEHTLLMVLTSFCNAELMHIISICFLSLMRLKW